MVYIIQLSANTTFFKAWGFAVYIAHSLKITHAHFPGSCEWTCDSISQHCLHLGVANEMQAEMLEEIFLLRGHVCLLFTLLPFSGGLQQTHGGLGASSHLKLWATPEEESQS